VAALFEPGSGARLSPCLCQEFELYPMISFNKRVARAEHTAQGWRVGIEGESSRAPLFGSCRCQRSSLAAQRSNLSRASSQERRFIPTM
jgi:hypothetical protein